MRLITVGKSDTNDIVLNYNAVSRIHMEIFIDDDQNIFVTDKNSTNGTFVNGNRITGSKLITKFDIVKAANSIVNWKRYILDSQNMEQGEEMIDQSDYEPSDIEDISDRKPKKSKALWWVLFAIIFTIYSVLYYLNLDGVKIRGSWHQEGNYNISYIFDSDRTFTYDSLGVIKSGEYSLNTKEKIITLNFDSNSLPAYPYTVIIENNDNLEPAGPRTVRRSVPSQYRDLADIWNYKLREIGNIFNVFNKSDYDIKILSISPFLVYNTIARQEVYSSKDYKSIERMKFNHDNFDALLEGKFAVDINNFLINEIDDFIIKPKEKISLYTILDKDILVDRNARVNRSQWYSDRNILLSDGILVYRWSHKSRRIERKFSPFNGKIVLGDLNPQKEFKYRFVEKHKIKLNNQLYLK